MSREFNRMSFALEERERELIRGERLAAIGQMAVITEPDSIRVRTSLFAT